MYLGEGAKRLRAKCRDVQAKLVPERTIFWEAKNYMGVAKTMPRAPKRFQSPPEISGQILTFLMEATEEHREIAANKTVVTVPACFQPAQRRDTLDACEMAGLDIAPGDLLDEPVAAFLHFLFSRKDQPIGQPGQDINCLIFDFGGGTCDVAIFRARPPHPGQALRVAPKAVSRYHKLGGGDIDRAIVHEILIPQIVAQQGLSAHDLDFELKKNALEPALLSTAEMLKIGLCRELDRYQRLNRLEDQNQAEIVKTYPGRIECPGPDGKTLYLDTPSLNASEFTHLMRPFLDTDIPYHTETEYRWTCSAFVPLEEALCRAGLEADDINLCLLVGGSSRIPHLRRALADYFSQASVHALSESETQTAVASGACLHAFMLQALGRSLVQPCCAESIFVQTRSGPRLLIQANTALPHPGQEAWSSPLILTVPESNRTEPLVLRIELLDSQDRILGRWPWEIQAPVDQGQEIQLVYRMDANQTLFMELSLPGKPEQEIKELRLENPVTSVVNPNSKRQRILDLEEAMRTSRIPRDEQLQTTREITELYQDIGQREKSVSIYKKILRHKGPDPHLLNRVGMLYGEIGDYAREEKYYLQADVHSRGWKGPLFNLALSYRRQGRYVEAASTLDKALQANRNGPYLVLRALIAEAMQDWEGKQSLLDEAMHLFAPVSSLSDWELHWYTTAVRMLGLSDSEHRARQERKTRTSDQEANVPEGTLPEDGSQPART